MCSELQVGRYQFYLTPTMQASWRMEEDEKLSVLHSRMASPAQMELAESLNFAF